MNKAQLEKEVSNLGAALTLIEDAGLAFIAIGDMLQPEGKGMDEQLNLVYRSQAAAIFRFFGRALEGPVRAAVDSKDRLEFAVMKEGAA